MRKVHKGEEEEEVNPKRVIPQTPWSAKFFAMAIWM
jgi:hypothetical protein